LKITARKTINEGMMKRNKRTEIMAHEELTPLTEQILAQLGQEGAAIRRRLKFFYRQRALDNRLGSEDPVGESP
jgi:hypothetical protein